MSANPTATGRPIILRYLGRATGRGTYKILAYLSQRQGSNHFYVSATVYLSVSSSGLLQSQNQIEATLGTKLSTMLWSQPNLTSIAYHVI